MSLDVCLNIAPYFSAVSQIEIMTNNFSRFLYFGTYKNHEKSEDLKCLVYRTKVRCKIIIRGKVK